MTPARAERFRMSSIAGAVWPSTRHKERCWMVVFKCYYDASGADGGSGHLVVVGLVATERKWIKFEQRWEAVLSRYGVTHFHMKDYAHSRGEYATWKDKKEKRATFVADLLKAIKVGINKGYFSSVANETIAAVNELYVAGGVGWGAAYPLAANVCRRRLETFVQRKYPGSPIHHVFEKGDKNQGTLRELMDRYQRGSAGYSFVPKLQPNGVRLRPFEAADLIAYEAKRALDDREVGSARPIRKSALEIGRTLPMMGYVIGKERLLEICAKAPPDIIRRRA